MIFINAQILDGDFRLRKADIEIDDERIVRLADTLSYTEHDLVVDCAGYTIVPGFVDIHVHGGAGADTCDADAQGLREMAKFLLTKGVTSFCPTTMTVSNEEIAKSLETVRSCMEDKDGARIVGVNLEGPFISPAKKGAQGDEFIQAPDYDVFKALYDGCGGIIKLVDIAPECDVKGGFIEKASKFCTVSVAHTATGYEGAKAAFQAGATHATHLFNAMSGMTHRAPGVVGAVFDTDTVRGELICDGIHIHPAVVRTVFKLMPRRVCVVSDAMRLSGMEDGGQGMLGVNLVTVKDGKATLEDGTIAGSVTNLHDELKNLVSWGIPLEKAVRAMTLTPAEAIGMEKEIGSIAVGKRADLVVLDENLEIVAVYH